MTAIDEVRRTILAERASGEVDGAWWTGQVAEHEQAMRRLTEAMRAANEATQTLGLARKRDRHRRLFGHPLARVFVVGNRLVVVHPRGGVA